MDYIWTNITCWHCAESERCFRFSTQAEDRPDGLIVRLYESHGSTVATWLQTALPIQEAVKCV